MYHNIFGPKIIKAVYRSDPDPGFDCVRIHTLLIPGHLQYIHLDFVEQQQHFCTMITLPISYNMNGLELSLEYNNSVRHRASTVYTSRFC